MKPRSSRLRLVVAGLLAVALVASCVWLAFGIRDRVGNDESQPQDRRDTVMLQAREYMLAAWNFGAADLDDEKLLTKYRDRVNPLITTSFRTDFEKASALLEKAVAKEGYSRKATVERTAVESSDVDNAKVIVGGQATERISGQQPVVTPYAWTITLKRVDGAWLVDDFSEFGGQK